MAIIDYELAFNSCISSFGLYTTSDTTPSSASNIST